MKESVNVSLRIGLNIRARRHAMRLTLKALAERVGCSTQKITDIEHGRRNMRVNDLLAFSHALECALTDLTIGL